MKKILIILLMSLFPLLRLDAQVSEEEQVFLSTSNDYIQYKSIVRNYNDSINVLMVYGHFLNQAAPDSAVGRCTFLIQNTNTGNITRLFEAPQGYEVNDVKFVTLRRINSYSTVDFCCVCGTRSKYHNTISMPNPGSGPSLYIDVYKKHGFAGFFSMAEALNPTTSFTAKFRDVEKTKELYRMTCYAEQYGHYYSYQNTFIDNAVLDIIGLDDTVNAPSCFCRAKFYPDCYGSVRWDNNIRCNQVEILSDIVKTDSYVVTSSHNTNGDSLWIRYSGQEDHLIPGGLQLNANVNGIDFSSLSIDISCENTSEIWHFDRRYPARICHTKGNGIEIAYCMVGDGYEGLLNCQYEYPNGSLSFYQGAYLKSTPLPNELIFMPDNEATAIFYSENNILDYVSILTWKKDIYCNYPVKQYYNNNMRIQSLTLQNRNTFEHLLWSSKETGNIYSPIYLMSQRGELGGGYLKTCHETLSQEAQPAVVEHADHNRPMPIKYRFAYDEATYPVYYVHFNPYSVEREMICVK